MTKTIEREMVTDLIDCSLNDFVGLIKDSDKSVKIGMLGVLRSYYQQMELALKDLRDKIEEKNSFTDEEKDLHIDLAKEMVNVEERCRLLVDEIGESEGFVEGSFISSEDIKL